MSIPRDAEDLPVRAGIRVSLIDGKLDRVCATILVILAHGWSSGRASPAIAFLGTWRPHVVVVLFGGRRVGNALI